jgi:drug/metabolite transporter (DMT)-like permease
MKTRSVSGLYKPLYDLFRLPWHVWIIIVLSGLGGYMGTLFYLWAISLMSDAGAAIIMEAWPLLAVLIAPVLLKNHAQKIRFLDLILIAVLVLGSFMICASDTGLSFEEFITNPLFMFTGRSFEEFSGMLCAFMAAFCYAWAGVSRPYFLAQLPQNYKDKYLTAHKQWYESLYAFWLTCLTAIPLSLFCAIWYENGVFIPPFNFAVTTLLGIFLTTMGCFYAYSLMLAKSSTINLLWYISPVLAATWLVVFGYSEVTPLLIAGAFLIILANLILILTDTDDAVAHIDEEHIERLDK